MIDVLLAAAGVSCEEDLVATAPASGVRILRRCVDAVDVLAAVATFPQALPIVSASLPRMVAATVDRLGSSAVGLADDDDDVERLHGLGLTRIVRSDAEPLWRSLVHPEERQQQATPPEPVMEREPVAEGPTGPPAGRLVAVWGPPGAPGRTTVAMALADALSRAGHDTCLVDADTYAPSIAMALGVQGPGIAAACRRALVDQDAGTRSSCAAVHPRLAVLAGVPTTRDWTELRTASLEALWVGLRRTFDVTLVDVGACVEDDDGGAPWTRRRNAAAVTALLEADRVVVVGRSSPEGAARLAAAWDTLPGAAPRLVVGNRADRGSRDWPDVIRALGIDARVIVLPDDPRAVGRCWAYGATLTERAGRSGLARAVRALAATLVGD